MIIKINYKTQFERIINESTYYLLNQDHNEITSCPHPEMTSTTLTDRLKNCVQLLCLHVDQSLTSHYQLNIIQKQLTETGDMSLTSAPLVASSQTECTGCQWQDMIRIFNYYSSRANNCRSYCTVLYCTAHKRKLALLDIRMQSRFLIDFISIHIFNPKLSSSKIITCGWGNNTNHPIICGTHWRGYRG